MKPVIAAVGSSSLIANEICHLVKILLNDQFTIFTICTKDVTSDTKADFFVCASTQYKRLQKIVPIKNIFVVTLTPTSSFFFQLARIPHGQTVYIFNNQLAYTNILADYCRTIGLNNLNFQSIAYDEMPENEIIQRLKRAKYIIGVDCFVDEHVLLTDKYKKHLVDDVKILAGKRTISVPSACAFLKGITDFYYEFIVKEQKKLSKQVLQNTIPSDALSTSTNMLIKKLNKIIAVIRTATVQTVANQVDLIATPWEEKKSAAISAETTANIYFDKITANLAILKSLSDKLQQISKAN